MKILDFSTRAEMDDAAASYISTLVKNKPDAVIALPTGETPLGLYRNLAARQREGAINCQSARFFNLDEFEGKGLADEGSYAGFLMRHAFEPLHIAPDHLRLLQGDALDVEAECRAYDAAIDIAGGLDLAVLGLGRNGHVAFNEPGDDWRLGTHRVALTQTTREAQSGIYQASADVPNYGLTMGVATVLAARKLLLLVTGQGKEDALNALISGRPDPDRSVTALVDHPDLTVLRDLSSFGS
ncbi:glucosamine-6-phosphate deaminase [Brucella sp. NBRC 12950]|uniref:glucosamine-6-phosphate deaminase n=1 Tax=Brucella sp. NBRC 12950 TaxID=2994518 RepID=UPI0024A33F35|nr:glucosamine-6-phosphate deaminase [Brucella sp. NBRC 12950]GLU27371.1 glucosamine-6-phosphate deaminase 1 [Brucella sp. NBRC 12950]